MNALPIDNDDLNRLFQAIELSIACSRVKLSVLTANALVDSLHQMRHQVEEASARFDAIATMTTRIDVLNLEETNSTLRAIRVMATHPLSEPSPEWDEAPS